MQTSTEPAFRIRSTPVARSRGDLRVLDVRDDLSRVTRANGEIVGYVDRVDVAGGTAYRARRARTVRDQLAATRDDLDYARFLTWRGFLQQEPPRRPEPDRPAAPPSLRTEAWKYALVGSRDETGFVQLFNGRDLAGWIERGVLSVMDNVDTNLSPSELFEIAQAVAQVDPGKMSSCVVPGGIGNIGGASVVIPNTSTARRYGDDARKDATIKSC